MNQKEIVEMIEKMMIENNEKGLNAWTNMKIAQAEGNKKDAKRFEMDSVLYAQKEAQCRDILKAIEEQEKSC